MTLTTKIARYLFRIQSLPERHTPTLTELPKHLEQKSFCDGTIPYVTVIDKDGVEWDKLKETNKNTDGRTDDMDDRDVELCHLKGMDISRYKEFKSEWSKGSSSKVAAKFFVDKYGKRAGYGSRTIDKYYPLFFLLHPNAKK